MDGTPFTDTTSGQLGAATVVIQQVTAPPEPFPEESSGSTAPVARTVGAGQALVLRDGAAFAATWSRSKPDAATTFTTTAGEPLPFAPGPAWVFLMPSTRPAP